MFWRKTVWLFLSVAVCTLSALAQESVEYGSADELRGVTKIFVNTGADLEQRAKIVKEIQKRLPKLEIVARPEESDIHLSFSVKEISAGETKTEGAVVKIIGKNRVRVLWSFKDNFPPIFARDSIVNYGIEFAKPQIFARQFVKAYAKVNAEGRA